MRGTTFIIFIAILAIVFLYHGDNGSATPVTSPPQQFQTPVPLPSYNTTYQTIQTQVPVVSPVEVSPPPSPLKENESGLITKTFPFVLRGVSGYISMPLYSGVESEIKSESQPVACYRYDYDSSPCNSRELDSYYLQYLNNPTQTKYLDELVDKIRTRTSITDDQVRIAVSLVQNIPYDYNELESSSSDVRYPYSVLYDNSGVCEEKSLTLAYILRGLGYGVALFDYPEQRHMAVGIKSNSFIYENTGYSFIETTIPTIITYSSGNYLVIGKLTEHPIIYEISDGHAFNPGEDGIDAITYDGIEQKCQNTYFCTLDSSDYYTWQSLVSKYGIKTEN